LSLQIAFPGEEPTRKFFRESFSAVVCIVDGHVQNSFREAFIFRVGICLNHHRHPGIKAIGCESWNVRSVGIMILYQVMLASEVSIYLGECRIG